MRITQISLQRPVTTLMLFLAIVILGVVSVRELSVDLLPDIRYPRLSVVTQYPGVSPEEIETLITIPLETAASRIPGLQRVESVSKEGISYLRLEFAWGTDMDFGLLHTREKLDSVVLPEEVENPAIILLDPRSKPIMVLSLSGERSLIEFREFSEELIKPRLEQIEGIGSAEIVGGLEREIQVEVKPELLSLYGLSIDQISNRIDAFNSNLQAGTVRKGPFRYAIRIVGEFESVSEIGEISLVTKANRGIIRLKDVAQIKDSIKKRDGLIRLNGRESIGILLRKKPGANTVRVTQTAREVLKEIKKENPQVKIRVVSEQARYIEDAIALVLKSIILGGILSFFVLLLFFQELKTPLIIAVVIPISVLATLSLLYFRNITLNIMSLGGIALGVGMLVDNSIVVSESIFRYRHHGKKPSEASFAGTGEVAMAVTASTFTTLSVFLPVIYTKGVTGQLFKDLVLSVAFSLFSSLIVSLSLLPMLYAWKFEIEKEDRERTNTIGGKGKKEYPKKRSLWMLILYPYWILRKLGYLLFKSFYWILERLSTLFLRLYLLAYRVISALVKPVFLVVFRSFSFVYRRFTQRYHRHLIWSLENKGRVLSISLVFLILTFLLATQIPRELMPEFETSSFELNVITPTDYSPEQTADVVSVLERGLAKEESVNTTFSQIGLVSGMESLNPAVSLNSAKMFVKLKSPKDLKSTIKSLRLKAEKIPGLVYSIAEEEFRLAQYLALPSSDLSLKIKGDDLGSLKRIAGLLVKKLEIIEGIENINMNSGDENSELLVKINKKAFEKYDIAPADIGNFLVNAVRGKIASQFKEFDKKYGILVRLEDKTIEKVESLLDVNMPYKGALIPLRELVSCKIIDGPSEILRENQQREVLVRADLIEKKPSQIIPKIREKIDELGLASNYRIIFGGEQEEMTESFKSLIFAFSLAVLLVYMIMAAQFESLLLPFLILFTLPMGLAGAVWALLLTGQTLNLISFIGVVVLVGIVVNDAIVKIDCTNQLRKKGFGVRKAILEASRVRLRPILMTTTTTVLGLSPMAFGSGKGAELQRPLAIPVMGGLIFATFLTLVLIPIAYELFEKRKP